MILILVCLELLIVKLNHLVLILIIQLISIHGLIRVTIIYIYALDVIVDIHYLVIKLLVL